MDNNVNKKYTNQILYTDIKPFEVIKECTEKLYVIREMKCTPTINSINALKKSFIPGGFIGHTDNYVQEWAYASDIDAPLIKIRKHKNGIWYDTNGMKYQISDKPIKFYDYNF